MVQRQSESVSFSTRQDNRVSQAAPGAARIQAGNTSTREIDVDGKFRDGFLNAFLGTAGKLAEQQFDRRIQEEYLRGASQVGQITAEAELEGDPMTRDWAVAGFRDMSGKLLMAQSDAQIAADMPTLREQSPADFQKYLAQRRDKITPQLQGMSFAQRQASFGKLLTSDQAAIQKHRSAHAEWVVEQRIKPVQMSVALAVQGLEDARLRNDAGAYNSAYDNLVAQVYGGINFDPALAGHAEKLNLQVLETLLSSNQVDAAERFANTPMPANVDGTGAQTSLLSRMSLESQTKFGNKLREANDRTETQRNFEWRGQDALNDAAMTTGTFDMSPAQYGAFVESGVQRGAIKGGQVSSMLQKYYEYRDRELKLARLNTAATSGDIGMLAALGGTESDAVAAVVKTGARLERTPAQQVASLVQVGTRGFNSAYTEAGKIMAPAFRTIADAKGNINASSAALVQQTLSMVEGLESQGYQNVKANMLAGLPEDARARAQRYMHELKQSGDAQQAYNATLAKEAELGQLSPQARAALAGTSMRKFVAHMDEEFTSQVGAIGRLFSSTFSTEADTLARHVGWFGQSEEAAAGALAQMRTELLASAERITTLDPHLSPESVLNSAKADILGRTVRTAEGPLIAPPGASIGGLYKIPVAVQSQIGPAIDAITLRHKKAFPNAATVHYSMFNGLVSVRGVDENGAQVFSRTVPQAELQEEVNARVRLGAESANQMVGAGVEYKGLQFNGTNTAGVHPSVMLRFRQNLATHESVEYKAYRDPGNGKLNIGVGINETNDFFPKHLNLTDNSEVSPAVVRDTFNKASTAAASAGLQIAKEAGLRGDAAKLLTMEFAYQAGPAGARRSEYVALYNAINAGDAAAAEEAFMQTGAYKGSHEARRKSYLALIKQAAKE